MANHIWKVGEDLVETKKGARIHWEEGNYFTVELFGKKFHGEVVNANTEYGNLTLKINHRVFDVHRSRPIDSIITQLGLDKIVEKKLTTLNSPMPGKVLDIQVKIGDTIEKGSSLITLEAMKMENVIKSEGVGVVKEIVTAVGDTVEKDAILIEFE